MTTATTAARPHAFALLLDRYVSESVSDAAFAAARDLTDDAGLSPAERLAFARFTLDAHGADVPMPTAAEFADVVQIACA